MHNLCKSDPVIVEPIRLRTPATLQEAVLNVHLSVIRYVIVCHLTSAQVLQRLYRGGTPKKYDGVCFGYCWGHARI